VHVIHGGEEGEVALVLDYSESEATPFQRIGYVHDMRAYFVDRQVALIDRHELNICWIFDCVPDEHSVVGLFEPTAERVVPT
jgi:hypothetical protein